ncbi:hypothetical protein [Adhaeribacter rhizoryzae]|uniref:STAS/SEC14 domain-containing protein n=1 Tax=Adhaeribacter rhizoryzae TaxID=2607907 RepID=A0A5M6CTH4_9BACT|nr:hypothetical protein [Adhaeribacter rhizoryzae]KAA5538618.1 hypothetical protein F0145_25825 [Adhaeribacter rhizoryzae]
MMLLLQTTYLEVNYYRQEQLLETSWKGPCSSQEYRDCLNTYSNILQKYKIKRWLDDQALAGQVRQADQFWTVQEWTANFIPLASKLKKVAQVNALEGHTYSLSTILQQVIYAGKCPFAFREFDSHPEAKTWLLS